MCILNFQFFSILFTIWKWCNNVSWYQIVEEFSRRHQQYHKNDALRFCFMTCTNYVFLLLFPTWPTFSMYSQETIKQAYYLVFLSKCSHTASVYVSFSVFFCLFLCDLWIAKCNKLLSVCLFVLLTLQDVSSGKCNLVHFSAHA